MPTNSWWSIFPFPSVAVTVIICTNIYILSSSPYPEQVTPASWLIFPSRIAGCLSIHHFPGSKVVRNRTAGLMSQARAWRLVPNHGQLSLAHRHQHEPSVSLFAAWRQKQRQFPNPSGNWKGTSISELREVLKPIPFCWCRVVSAGAENKHTPPLLKKRIGFGWFYTATTHEDTKF